VYSLSVVLVFLSYPAHFLSPAKENGGKECRQGQAPAPQLAKLSPSALRASGLQTVARKVNKHIEDHGYILFIAVNHTLIMLSFCLYNP